MLGLQKAYSCCCLMSNFGLLWSSSSPHQRRFLLPCTAAFLSQCSTKTVSPLPLNCTGTLAWKRGLCSLRVHPFLQLILPPEVLICAINEFPWKLVWWGCWSAIHLCIICNNLSIIIDLPLLLWHLLTLLKFPQSHNSASLTRKQRNPPAAELKSWCCLL